MKLTVTTGREESMDGAATTTGCCRKIPLRGVLAVVGGILIHLTLGTQLTFGKTRDDGGLLCRAAFCFLPVFLCFLSQLQ